MSCYGCCEVCDGRDPHWYIMRTGDVVVTWACDEHLSPICERLQRDGEVTELTVRDSRKGREYAAISRNLNRVAAEVARLTEGGSDG